MHGKYYIFYYDPRVGPIHDHVAGIICIRKVRQATPDLGVDHLTQWQKPANNPDHNCWSDSDIWYRPDHSIYRLLEVTNETAVS